MLGLGLQIHTITEEIATIPIGDFIILETGAFVLAENNNNLIIE
tara:strand:- start:89 stop:220 length:132 start_codon:yes stop_codon:yes gene_type:complete